jgi:hypothetical protein
MSDFFAYFAGLSLKKTTLSRPPRYAESSAVSRAFLAWFPARR